MAGPVRHEFACKIEMDGRFVGAFTEPWLMSWSLPTCPGPLVFMSGYIIEPALGAALDGRPRRFVLRQVDFSPSAERRIGLLATVTSLGEQVPPPARPSLIERIVRSVRRAPRPNERRRVKRLELWVVAIETVEDPGPAGGPLSVADAMSVVLDRFSHDVAWVHEAWRVLASEAPLEILAGLLASGNPDLALAAVECMLGRRPLPAAQLYPMLARSGDISQASGCIVYQVPLWHRVTACLTERVGDPAVRDLLLQAAGDAALRPAVRRRAARAAGGPVLEESLTRSFLDSDDPEQILEVLCPSDGGLRRCGVTWPAELRRTGVTQNVLDRLARHAAPEVREAAEQAAARFRQGDTPGPVIPR